MSHPLDLTETVSSAEAKLLATILQGVRDDMTELKESVKGVNENLRILTKLEVEHSSTREALARSFEAVAKLEARFLDASTQSLMQRDNLDQRLHAVERNIPEHLTDRLHALERDSGPLKEVRRWVISGVLGGIGLILLALVSMVVRPAVPVNITIPAEFIEKLKK